MSRHLALLVLLAPAALIACGEEQPLDVARADAEALARGGTCPDGSPPVQCLIDPCLLAPQCEGLTCVANYCGGCNTDYFDRYGQPAECDGDSF